MDSLANSVLPASTKWEVLVVDNNSSDRTPKTVTEVAERYPAPLRYISEPNQGKSFALNTGIGESRGDILVFLDDDVTVEPTWLRNLTAALSNDKWAGVGGRTLPTEPFSPPSWLPFSAPYCFGGILCALFDLGEEPCELRQAPYGANMAFRKVMFERYGRFRTDLGPSPFEEIPRPNEDTEFGRRLMAAGERLRYEPSAVVYHPIPKERLNKEYFLAWWFDLGRAEIRERGSRPRFYGIPRHYLSIPRMIGTHLSVRALHWICSFNAQERFFWKCWTWVMAGEIVETYRLARVCGETNKCLGSHK